MKAMALARRPEQAWNGDMSARDRKGLDRTLGRREFCVAVPAALGAMSAGGALVGCRGSGPGISERDPVHVSLDAPIGAFGRLSGVQGSPYPEVPEDVEHVAAYVAHHIERARFPQDCPANELTLAGIFPDEGADPDDPASYRFEAIDRHVAAARDAGLRVLWQSSYDVGLSDRWVGLNLGGRPIADLDRWARVLARCLEHFTVGWASGFDRAIADVELLNEPDGLGGYRDMPGALYLAFRRFLEVVDAHNQLHPGASVRPVGPGIPFSIAEWPAYYRDDIDRMLTALVADGLSLPVFSFHTYGANVSPAGNANLARELRALLDEHGMTATELWNTEWQGGGFLEGHLGLDAARLRDPSDEDRRLYARGLASYALSCKARWQGVVTGSYYYRAGKRAWPPGMSSPFGEGDGTAGFFSPEGRVGALALHELLTHRIAERTPERCAIEIADDAFFTGLGLRGDAAAGALLMSLGVTARRALVRFTGGADLTIARVVRIDTDAQALVEEDVSPARAEDGAIEVELSLGPLESALIELG
jgi:hypothetical protein